MIPVEKRTDGRECFHPRSSVRFCFSQIQRCLRAWRRSFSRSRRGDCHDVPAAFGVYGAKGRMEGSARAGILHGPNFHGGIDGNHAVDPGDDPGTGCAVMSANRTCEFCGSVCRRGFCIPRRRSRRARLDSARALPGWVMRRLFILRTAPQRKNPAELQSLQRVG